MDTTEDKMYIGMMLMFLVLFIITGAFTLYSIFGDKPIREVSNGTVVIKTSNTSKLSYSGLFWKTIDGWTLLGNTDSGVEKWRFSINKDLNPKKIEEIKECLGNTYADKVKLSYKTYFLLPIKYGYSHQVQDCEVQDDVLKSQKKENK